MENQEQPPTLISDLDHPFTEEELKAIDAAFETVSSSSSTLSARKLDSPADHRPKTRRRLPESLKESKSKTPFKENNSMSSTRLRWLKDLDSHQDKSKLIYPEVSFQGKIVYSRTAFEVDRASKELLKVVQAKKKEGGHIVLGFDIEWKPTFRRGVLPGKAAVMQICGDANHCHVMHIIHSGIPSSLRSLLEDPSCIKVGVNVGGDANKVYKDHKVSVEALEDLSSLANQKMIGGNPKRWSLGSLTETLICKKLPKPSRIRLGNWEVAALSKAQLQYAATDAFASWYIYEVLKKFPDPPCNKSEEVETVAQQQSLADGPTACNISD
ncbi:3'-5' exonuclease-like [Apium graveolens]|uniref:3'-5' exonuclease-like n=1 Tax=Apium graveolens TaxID=4045 RepID=UPI003D78EFF5